MKSFSGNPAVGPDIFDVATTMRAMQTLHRCQVAVVITPGHMARYDGVTVEVQATPKVAGLAEQSVACVTVVKGFPYSGSRSLDAHIYGLLLSLDGVLSQEFWEQETFA